MPMIYKRVKTVEVSKDGQKMRIEQKSLGAYEDEGWTLEGEAKAVRAPSDSAKPWNEENIPSADDIATMKESELLKVISGLSLDTDISKISKIAEKRDAVATAILEEFED